MLRCHMSRIKKQTKYMYTSKQKRLIYIKSNSFLFNLGCLMWWSMKTHFCLFADLVLGLSVFSHLLIIAVMHAGNDISVSYYKLKVCAIKGSTATLYCRVEPPGQKVIWVAGSRSVDLKAELQYSGRVKYSYDYKWTRYILEISDVTWSDSAEYHCRVPAKQSDTEWTAGISLLVTGDVRCLNSVFRDDSANFDFPLWLRWCCCSCFTCTDVQVKVLAVSSRRITLKCHSNCQLSIYDYYIWYENGKEIPEETSSTWSGFYRDESSLSCAAEGQEKFVSPPVCKFLHTELTMLPVHVNLWRKDYTEVRSNFLFAGIVWRVNKKLFIMTTIKLRSRETPTA